MVVELVVEVVGSVEVVVFSVVVVLSEVVDEVVFMVEVVLSVVVEVVLSEVVDEVEVVAVVVLVVEFVTLPKKRCGSCGLAWITNTRSVMKERARKLLLLFSPEPSALTSDCCQMVPAGSNLARSFWRRRRDAANIPMAR